MPVSDWDPTAILKKHVREAAGIWRKKQEYLNFRKSVLYDVIIDGKPYPPKVISAIAYELATGKSLRADKFAGARDGVWHRRLKALGFEIVEKAGEIELELSVAQSLKLTSKQRQTLIAKTADDPIKKVAVEVTRFFRNRHVVAERLYIANGICEMCGNPAPFSRYIDGQPYLEVHHVKPLSENGPDSVENTQALCPNCHSEIHDRLRMERHVE
jgi:predicted HNH restriction endonuclease